MLGRLKACAQQALEKHKGVTSQQTANCLFLLSTVHIVDEKRAHEWRSRYGPYAAGWERIIAVQDRDPTPAELKQLEQEESQEPPWDLGKLAQESKWDDFTGDMCVQWIRARFIDFQPDPPVREIIEEACHFTVDLMNDKRKTSRSFLYAMTHIVLIDTNYGREHTLFIPLKWSTTFQHHVSQWIKGLDLVVDLELVLELVICTRLLCDHPDWKELLGNPQLLAQLGEEKKKPKWKGYRVNSAWFTEYHTAYLFILFENIC